MIFWWFADFFQNYFVKKFFQEHYVYIDPDQDQHSVGPDLGPNCLFAKSDSR